MTRVDAGDLRFAADIRRMSRMPGRGTRRDRSCRPMPARCRRATASGKRPRHRSRATIARRRCAEPRSSACARRGSPAPSSPSSSTRCARAAVARRQARRIGVDVAPRAAPSVSARGVTSSRRLDREAACSRRRSAPARCRDDERIAARRRRRCRARRTAAARSCAAPAAPSAGRSCSHHGSGSSLVRQRQHADDRAAVARPRAAPAGRSTRASIGVWLPKWSRARSQSRPSRRTPRPTSRLCIATVPLSISRQMRTRPARGKRAAMTADEPAQDLRLAAGTRSGATPPRLRPRQTVSTSSARRISRSCSAVVDLIDLAAQFVERRAERRP